MSKRLIDVAKSNTYLFDLLFRHQVYLEGIKAGFARQYASLLQHLYGEFARYVGQSKYDTLDAFTRIELQNFIRLFQNAQTKVYNQYTQQLIDLLKQLVAADVAVTQAIYKAVDNNNVAPPPDAASLWASISTAVIPANGMTIPAMLDAFALASTAKVTQQLSKGSVNDRTLRETLAQIVGQSDLNYRDGLFATFVNQNNALMATAIQHVSSMTQASIASEFYDQYQWVALLDSRTTEICLSRNGNVYIYSEGPLPPAHYNCRSKAVSLTNGAELHDIPNSFYDWLVTQPVVLLADMLGAAVAAKIAARDNTVRDISVNDAVIPLTLTQFRSKIDFIVM